MENFVNFLTYAVRSITFDRVLSPVLKNTEVQRRNRLIEWGMVDENVHRFLVPEPLSMMVNDDYEFRLYNSKGRLLAAGTIDAHDAAKRYYLHVTFTAKGNDGWEYGIQCYRIPIR